MTNRKRTHKIWLIPDEKFRILCKNAKTISDILKPYKLQNQGRDHYTAMQRIREQNIDISHIPLGKNSNKNRPVSYNGKPLKGILIENAKVNRTNIKKRLIREGFLENKCNICGLKEVWQGKPITLVLDHINGKNDDYRIENLQLVCPNCNSQLPTFAGRNAKKGKKKYICPDCGREINKSNKRCNDCYMKHRYH